MGALHKLPDLFSAAEVAEYLGISVATLLRLRKAGKIAFIKAGMYPRFTEQHINDYLKAQECNASNSGSTGSNIEKAPRTGKGRGVMKKESSSALALAQQILNLRK